jgi:hypothetical protein
VAIRGGKRRLASVAIAVGIDVQRLRRCRLGRQVGDDGGLNLCVVSFYLALLK